MFIQIYMSLHRVGSLTTVSRELARYSGGAGGQMGGQWHQTCGRIHIFYRNGNENQELGTGFFIRKRIISAIKRVGFVSGRMSYIILRGRWCQVIVLNVHAPTDDKTDDVKDAPRRNCNVCLINSLSST
jgi:hypothetical protein